MRSVAWCSECEDLLPVARDSLGFFECQMCGCPTPCGWCGVAFTDDHDHGCGEEL